MRSEYEDFAGYEKIIGIDEAGRGPIAGPVVVASVILPGKCEINNLNDSKKISAKKREEVFQEIVSRALHYQYKVIDHAVIDRINILQATFLGMSELMIPFESYPYLALIDGPFVPKKETTEQSNLVMKPIVKGDSIYKCIAAASIVAKVIRDNIMIEYHKKYPAYDFINNKGYPTKRHKAALQEYGISPIHRRSFAPVKNIIS